MAYILPNLSPALLHPKHRPPPPPPHPPSSIPPLLLPLSSSSLFPLTPPRSVAQVSAPPGTQDKQQQDHRDDFYVNLGLAVRTLREDLPLLFSKDLNYTIYREDVTFRDPLNTFTGIDKYKLIFWALRFHGRVLFREISLDVLRIWQPSENMILIRWNLRGVPRVPWEAKGEFQGTSRYKLDRNAKIYEHIVDNLAFNFPQRLATPTPVLDLVAPTPNPTFSDSSSWVQFYMAVKQTLEQRDDLAVPRDCFAPCL